MTKHLNKRITFDALGDPMEEARRLIDLELAAQGGRSVKAIANLSGLSTTTIYRYRKDRTACRMQLPTFMALKASALKKLS